MDCQRRLEVEPPMIEASRLPAQRPSLVAEGQGEARIRWACSNSFLRSIRIGAAASGLSVSSIDGVEDEKDCSGVRSCPKARVANSTSCSCSIFPAAATTRLQGLNSRLRAG